MIVLSAPYFFFFLHDIQVICFAYCSFNVDIAFVFYVDLKHVYQMSYLIPYNIQLHPYTKYLVRVTLSDPPRPSFS